jgi:hypothetical protein
MEETSGRRTRNTRWSRWVRRSLLLFPVLAVAILSAGSQLLPAAAFTVPGRLPDAIRPIAGTGSGGAFGPTVIRSLRRLPSLRARVLATTRPMAPSPLVPAWPKNSHPTSFGRSRDASLSDPASGNPPASTDAGALRIDSSFTTYSTVDVDGATDGHYIVSGAGNLDLAVYTLSGSVVEDTSFGAFWCGANPLPICASGGFDGDNRVAYDTGAERWITTGIWVFGSNSIATDVLAVSQTNDPTGSWNLYQFPACGSFDTWDGGDQPRVGFNNQWIVVTSGCSASGQVNGAGLAVFDKAELYSGATLSLNENWFEFVDVYSAEGSYVGGVPCCPRDNPVTTYAPTTNNREYLTAPTINGSQASVVYSYVQGPVDAPMYAPAVETVTPGFSVSGPPAVDAPGCTGCMVSFSNGWIHSSGVWALRNGIPFVLSTMVMGDPRYANATQIINVATNTKTGAATVSRLAGGTNGFGPMASEIALPLAGNPGTALVAYDESRSDFYPGVETALWNIGGNTVRRVTVLQQGSLTPTNGDQNRWVDFLSALTPIPGSSRLVLAGTVAAPSATDSQRATYWATVTP